MCTTAAAVPRLGEMLLDIHGQHAHQSLVKSNVQRELLDGFAGCGAQVAKVEMAWRQWQDLRRQRLNWEKDAQSVEAAFELAGDRVYVATADEPFRGRAWSARFGPSRAAVLALLRAVFAGDAAIPDK